MGGPILGVGAAALFVCEHLCISFKLLLEMVIFIARKTNYQYAVQTFSSVLLVLGHLSEKKYLVILQ